MLIAWPTTSRPSKSYPGSSEPACPKATRTWPGSIRTRPSGPSGSGWATGPILFFDHHHAHAASAFFYSGFREAALLTVDGVDEWATTTYGRGEGATFEVFEEVHFPHSLGLLYATITSYLGFRVNEGEYKVMGLAPYGEPRYVDQVRELVQAGPDGKYTLTMAYFDFVSGRRMFSSLLCNRFGAPPREPGSEIKPFHCDVAKSLQLILEEMLLEKVRYLAGEVDSGNLCMAGGVALNGVANGRIVWEGPFERLFVQPAAGGGRQSGRVGAGSRPPDGLPPQRRTAGTRQPGASLHGG